MIYWYCGRKVKASRFPQLHAIYWSQHGCLWFAFFYVLSPSIFSQPLLILNLLFFFFPDCCDFFGDPDLKCMSFSFLLLKFLFAVKLMLAVQIAFQIPLGYV